MPQVSIIVPIYNVEPCLHQCIDSVLEQTFSDFELILVDDGSPDNCGVICDEYAQSDTRIHVIHKKNGGLSDARNAGLDAATGEYIFFLDGDDFVDGNLLETVVKHMETGIDMVVFRYRNYYEDGKTQEIQFKKSGEFVLESYETRRKFIVENLLTYNVGWEAWNRIYSRKVIEKFNLRFADNRKIFAEDLYFFLCYIVHVNKIRVIRDSLYNYRIRSNSIMAGQRHCLNIGRYNELAKAVLEHFQKWEACKKLAADFYSIHYMIVASHLISEYNDFNMSAPEFREKVRKDISDWDFFESQVRLQLKNWRRNTGFSQAEYYEQLCYMRYLLYGGYTLLRIQVKLYYLLYRFWDKENP